MSRSVVFNEKIGGDVVEPAPVCLQGKRKGALAHELLRVSVVNLVGRLEQVGEMHGVMGSENVQEGLKFRQV